MALVWVVPFLDELGRERRVFAGPDAFGVVRASFTDAAGTRFVLLNVPDVSPPLGDLKFTDGTGAVYGVPFDLVDVLGPWQTAFRAAESFGIVLLKNVLGLAPGHVQAQNTYLSATSTPVDGYWAEAGVEFSGCEQTDFGHVNGYRITGSFSAAINVPIERGERDLLTAVGAFVSTISDTRIGDVAFGEAWHIPFRRNDSQWQTAVTCPFRYDFEEAPKGPESPAPDLVSLLAPEVHAACRTLFADAVAAESLPTTYDNGAQPPSTTKRAEFYVMHGAADVAENGEENRRRSAGVALATLFVKNGVALDDAWRMVDVVATRFRGVVRGGVDFQVPSARSVGRVDDWWAIEIACPFYADQVREIYV